MKPWTFKTKTLLIFLALAPRLLAVRTTYFVADMDMELRWYLIQIVIHICVVIAVCLSVLLIAASVFAVVIGIVMLDRWSSDRNVWTGELNRRDAKEGNKAARRLRPDADWTG